LIACDLFSHFIRFHSPPLIQILYFLLTVAIKVNLCLRLKPLLVALSHFPRLLNLLTSSHLNAFFTLPFLSGRGLKSSTIIVYNLYTTITTLYLHVNPIILFAYSTIICWYWFNLLVLEFVGELFIFFKVEALGGHGHTINHWSHLFQTTVVYKIDALNDLLFKLNDLWIIIKKTQTYLWWITFLMLRLWTCWWYIIDVVIAR